MKEVIATPLIQVGILEKIIINILLKFNTREKWMKKLKQKKVLKSILFIVVCLIIGFIIGFISSKYSNKYMDSKIVVDNFFDKLVRMYGTLVSLLAGFLVHIIIHEAGHLIFGLMTGYSYVSFRIGSYTLVKQDKKLKFKRFNIPGTAGQCLMMPPKIIDGKFPFVIYNFGGAIMNIIVETMIPLFKFEINCERIFMELIGDCNKSIIDNLYDKSLKKYMKAAKYMIGKKRVWMTYEAFYNRDINMALKQYENIKDLASKYAIKGEADMELMISDWVIEKMQIETVN